MNYFLGVDGGQSSTTALIADQTGRVIGSGRGGPCYEAEAAVEESVRLAAQAAGLKALPVRFRGACLGFSGGPEDKKEIVERLIRSEQTEVTDDAVIALNGATGGQPGIIVIAGTGSIALGRNASGKRARAGGWGYVFGDEGSAFELARQAVRAALRFEEGWGGATALLELLLEATDAQSANQMMHLLYTPEWPRSRTARLALVVNQAARDGDGAALGILMEAAQRLAVFTGAVRGQLFAVGEPARVAYVGGVFRSDLLRERFRMLVELEEGNRCGPPRYGPAAGALLEAFRMAGVSTDLRDVPEVEK